MTGQVVLLLPRVCVRDVASVVRRHEVQTAIYLHCVGIVEDDNTLAHMFARNAVVVLEQGYVAVLADCHQFAFLHDKQFLGQGRRKSFSPRRKMSRRDSSRPAIGFSLKSSSDMCIAVFSSSRELKTIPSISR